MCASREQASQHEFGGNLFCFLRLGIKKHRGVLVKSMEPGSRMSGFKFWLCSGSWGNLISSACLSFPICKMGIIEAPRLRAALRLNP